MQKLGIKDSYRLLALLGRVDISFNHRDIVRDKIGGLDFYRITDKAARNNLYSLGLAAYNYFLEKEDYESIKEHFFINFGSVFEKLIFFSNDGGILDIIQNGLRRDKYSTVPYLITNDKTIEIEVDELLDDPVDDSISLPSQSLSLLVLNLLKEKEQCLETVIQQRLIHSTHHNYHNGVLILIADKQTVINNYEILNENFVLTDSRIVKLDLGVALVVKAKNINNDSLDDFVDKTEFTEMVSSDEMDMRVYNSTIQAPSIDYELLKKEHENILGISNTSSKDSNLWNWLKEETTTPEKKSIKIKKPTPLKPGEIANIIASGMINGYISNPDGSGGHIVAGGIKQQIRQNLVRDKNKQGDVITKTSTLVYAQPYLNLLINENGKLKIKEVKGGLELEWVR